MASNLFTFNPFSGVSEGIRLVANGVNPRNQRRLPLHIACGAAFVAIEQGWKHPPIRHGLLHEASLHLIEPANGNHSFNVLVPRNEGSKRLYCFVDSTVPAHIRSRVTGEMVRARTCVVMQGQARMVAYDHVVQSYLVEFSDEDDQLDVWYESGAIGRLVRRGNQIVSIRLTPSEIARERIEQFEAQFAESANVEFDIRRRHGIIAGAVRLLRYTTDRNAENELVDFLVDQLPHLTERMRAEIRELLLVKNHPFAGNFLAGSSMGNIVVLPTDPDSAARRAKAAQRRRDRSDADRELRLSMRGKGGGSDGKKKSNKK